MKFFEYFSILYTTTDLQIKYKCPICLDVRNVYKKKAALVQHFRMHTKFGFLCGEPGCPKTFARKLNRDQHQRIHSGKCLNYFKKF